MGRSYLGQDMWAADFTLPTPALLRSWAKETTLKASILYSGRQHANEVSSNSHLAKLGEMLVTDEGTRAMLRQVNVVLHPIDNPDGAELSIQLAKITPDNLLHPGYHGSLAADVAKGANPGRAWWIPRGWFTSLNYLRDSDHPYSQKLAFEIRDRLVEAERSVPGLLPLEERMNGRYERFGQRWRPKE